MFDELAVQLRSTFAEMRYGIPTRTITVAKPYCTPCRHIITAAFQRYGVKLYSYSEAARMVNPLMALKMIGKIAGDAGLTIPSALPVAQVAKVTVSEAAAAWAEYLLMRTGKLFVVPPYVNRRNEQWAAQHGGRMPPQWDKGQPWIERSCSEGVEAWQDAKRSLTSDNQRQRSRA